MSSLEQRFDEIKISGLLLPSASNSAISNNDEIDNAGQIRVVSRLAKRSVSSNIRKPQTLDVQSTYNNYYNYVHSKILLT